MAHQAQPARTTWCDPGNAALPQDNCKGHAVRRQSRRIDLCEEHQACPYLLLRAAAEL